MEDQPEFEPEDIAVAQFYFKCPHCPKEYKSKHYLDLHVNREHQSIYKCKRCDYVTDARAKLVAHANLVHETERNFKCRSCSSKFFSKHKLTVHRETVHSADRRFKCSLCNGAFARGCDLTRHMRSVHHKGQFYHCGFCDYKADWMESIARHEKDKHPEAAGRHSFDCKDCKRVFATLARLTVHNKLFHDATPGEFKCSFCPATYTRKSCVRVHERQIHLNPEQNKCKKCNYTAFENSVMYRHMVRSHYSRDITKKLTCVFCDIEFDNTPQLRQHLIGQHEIHAFDLGKVKCEYCALFFSHNFNMRSHMRKYHGLHRCARCSFTASSLFVLNKHMERHARVLAPTEHPCKACNLSFSSANALALHYTLVSHDSDQGGSPDDGAGTSEPVAGTSRANPLEELPVDEPVAGTSGTNPLEETQVDSPPAGGTETGTDPLEDPLALFQMDVDEEALLEYCNEEMPLLDLPDLPFLDDMDFE